MDKGIATSTIFLLVVGIVTVSLVIVLLVFNVGDTRDRSQCVTAQHNYCFDWDSEGSPPNNWGDYYSGQDPCTQPTTGNNVCNNLGYSV